MFTSFWKGIKPMLATFDIIVGPMAHIIERLNLLAKDNWHPVGFTVTPGGNAPNIPNVPELNFDTYYVLIKREFPENLEINR